MASTSTTGSDVWAAVPLMDTVKPTAAQKLVVINDAIRASHRWIKITQYEPSAGTLASTTFDYSMSALSPAPYRDIGISRVFIQAETSTTAPPEIHDVMQFFDASADAWKLRFAPSVASDYNTKTFDVEYLSPHADVAALSTSIFLPFEYLRAYCTWWAAFQKWSQQTTNANAVWREVMLSSKEDYQAALKGHKTLHNRALKVVPQRLV